MNGTMVGTMIEIPECGAFGMVTAERPTTIGPDGSVSALLQESPEQPAREWRWWRLAPGEWVEV